MNDIENNLIKDFIEIIILCCATLGFAFGGIMLFNFLEVSIFMEQYYPFSIIILFCQICAIYTLGKVILRGRDDLNSNKTPKEFCKD